MADRASLDRFESLIENVLQTFSGGKYLLRYN